MPKDFDNKAANLLVGKAQRPTPAPAAPAAAPATATTVEYKTERTQIVLRKSTKKALKAIAKKETAGSVNELISRICEEYIANYQK